MFWLEHRIRLYVIFCRYIHVKMSTAFPITFFLVSTEYKESPSEENVSSFLIVQFTSHNFILYLYILRVWSLFCSIRIFIGLHFLLNLLKTIFGLPVFYIFCLFCFEFNVFFEDILENICVIIIYIGNKGAFK